MEFEEGVSGDGKAELGEVVVQMVEDLRAGGGGHASGSRDVSGRGVAVERVAVDPSRKCLEVEDLLMTQMAKGRGPDPSSKATLWLKAQHEGALPPPCIVRKDPRVPHTARRGA